MRCGRRDVFFSRRSLTVTSDEADGSLNRESVAAWDTNAAFWDERMGEGNDFHLELVWPATERLLAIQPGDEVLDVACGNGLTCRRLAVRRVHVMGVDGSAEMIAQARRHGDDIDYRVLDCTDEAALDALGARRFDAAVCNMAIHDIAEIGPLFRGVAAVLKRRAPFVFSVLHPAFNSSNAVMSAELIQDGIEVRPEFSVKVTQYLKPTVTHGIAILGQPAEQPYFNRPLRVLLGAAFDAGFVVDGLEETAFAPGRGDGTLNWRSYPHIPPVLIVRARVQA
jgi:2-polyprenyl-3-methyl-5-hydroxy-6-metoxy-1,4-benzoquinol methylase